MNQLSKREKVLLYILAIMALAAGVVLLAIIPAQERGSELDEEIFNTQARADEMSLLIAQVNAMQSELDQLTADIELEKTYYLPVMDSDDLDRYITGLLQKHGLVAQSLEIVADGAQTERDMVQTYQINVVASGTVSDFVALAETVKDTKGVRIAGLSFTQQKARETTPTPGPVEKNVKKDRRTTPVPEPTSTPEPTPDNPNYAMNISFIVQEYNKNAEAEPLPEPESTVQPAN